MATNTTNYGFVKPDDEDFYDIQVENGNWDKADEKLKQIESGKLDKNGDASNATAAFTQATGRANLTSKEKISVSFGKLMKWYADMKAVAFSGNAADLIQDGTHRMVTDAEKAAWNGKVNTSGGDISNTKITSMDTISTEFPVPAANDTTKAFAGKVKKFITDFNNFKTGIITVGKLANNLQTTNAGYALDARAGKVLNDAVAQLNQDLERHQVSSDVLSLDIGHYFALYTCPNLPERTASFVDVEMIDNRKKITVSPHNANYFYINTYAADNNIWLGWDKMLLNSDLQSGIVTIANVPTGEHDFTFNFTAPFSTPPSAVVATIQQRGYAQYLSIQTSIKNLSSFIIRLENSAPENITNVAVYWIAK